MCDRTSASESYAHDGSRTCASNRAAMAAISGVAIVVSSGAGGGTIAGEEMLIGGRATIGVGIDRSTPATTRMLPC